MAQPDSTYVLYNRQTGRYDVPAIEEIVSSRKKNCFISKHKNQSYHSLSRYKGKKFEWKLYQIEFFVALRPNASHGLVILEVSRLHITTHHSR
jgi:hypothetical protein